MRLPAWTVAGMAFVLVRLVDHADAFRIESLGQLSCDFLVAAHGVA
jgi:hypothetical protein